MNNLTAPLSAFLTAIFLSGGVGAANYDPALSDPLVVAPSGIWQEVLPDGRSISVFGPRDPGPCGVTRPCVGGSGGVDYTSRPEGSDSVIQWIVPGFPGNGGGLVDNPACERAQGRPPFCDETPIVHPPVEPPVAPVPLPMGLHLFVAALFGFVVVRWFPTSLIDRPDRA